MLYRLGDCSEAVQVSLPDLAFHFVEGVAGGGEVKLPIQTKTCVRAPCLLLSTRESRFCESADAAGYY